MKDYTFKPLKLCKGRKYRFSPKLIRPICTKYKSNLCNNFFDEINNNKIHNNKVRFIGQLFRWLIKDPAGFKIKSYLNLISKKKINKINEGDIIEISCRTFKAAWKKLLSRLNIELIDYKILKRRKYNLLFSFLFLDLKENNKNITLDILTSKNENFHIFITLNSYFLKEFDIILDNNEI